MRVGGCEKSEGSRQKSRVRRAGKSRLGPLNIRLSLKDVKSWSYVDQAMPFLGQVARDFAVEQNLLPDSPFRRQMEKLVWWRRH